MSVGDVLTYFVHQLKASLEAAPSLRRGEAFLPVHLKGWRLSRYLFAPVAEHLASSLGWRLARERRISFPAKYQVWNSMCVDYVFTDELACRPTVYLELETLDRAQLYNFLPRRDDDVDDSKLWHYYGILAKHLENIERAPRALVFLLVLPDEPVDRYPLWDTARDVGLFSSALAPLVHQSPFRFFDPLIKSAGRLFLHRQEEFPNASGRWERRRIVDLQATCELIFITVTRTYMLVARGSDGLRHDAEHRFTLGWTG